MGICPPSVHSLPSTFSSTSPYLSSKPTSHNMSNQGYYQQGPPQGYYPPQQPQQAYQQGPPQQVIVREKKDRGCLGACLAALCCCFVCEEGCECCADCCECFAECC